MQWIVLSKTDSCNYIGCIEAFLDVRFILRFFSKKDIGESRYSLYILLCVTKENKVFTGRRCTKAM